MIVNEAFVRHFFAGRDPIGHKVHGWGEWFRIVGVAKDSKYHYFSESETPYFYVPFRQIYRTDMSLVFYVRAQGDPATVLSELRAQTRAIDPTADGQATVDAVCDGCGAVVEVELSRFLESSAVACTDCLNAVVKGWGKALDRPTIPRYASPS